MPCLQVFNAPVFFGLFVEKSIATVNPLNDSLRPYNVSSDAPMAPGQIVQVTLQVSSPDAIDGGLEVVDLLPGGLEAIDPRLPGAAPEPLGRADGLWDPRCTASAGVWGRWTVNAPECSAALQGPAMD